MLVLTDHRATYRCDRTRPDRGLRCTWHRSSAGLRRCARPTQRVGLPGTPALSLSEMPPWRKSQGRRAGTEARRAVWPWPRSDAERGRIEVLREAA
jgi:hypothetical protein